MDPGGSTLTEPENEQTAPPTDAPSCSSGGALARLCQERFAGPLWRVEEESRKYLSSESSRQADRKVIIVLLTVAICLWLQRYMSVLGVLDGLGQALALLGLEDFVVTSRVNFEQATTPLTRHFYNWCLGCLFTYFVLPALVIRLVLKERLGDYGARVKGAFASFWIYVLMLAIVLPAVFLMSANEHFQATYPFYPLDPDDALWPSFWRWELFYGLQFFALEFFFRGFLIHGTRQRFGIYSVFVMTVPYCMIHFGKPMQEAFASIIAGIVLGLMSLKTRSIWMGAILHVSVALSMDLTSLWRKEFFS